MDAGGPSPGGRAPSPPARPAHCDVTWPHDWQAPPDLPCGKLPEPTHTQPTCEVGTGEIAVPEMPELHRHIDFPHEHIYRLDGDEVAPESTHTVEPGTYTLELVEQYLHIGSHDTTVVGELVLKTWTIEIEEPDCPVEETTEDEELAATGSQTALIAGGALMLLALGAGLFLVARRRRVAFTA